VRPLVLTLTLVGVILFALKDKIFLPSQNIIPPTKVLQEKQKTFNVDPLEALSEKNISSLRTKFLNLKELEASWPSLPKSANDSLWIKGQQRRLHYLYNNRK